MNAKYFLPAAGLFAAFPAAAMINIDTVLVGDAGNANDSTGYGGVSYNYHIGTYEVTNSQYTAFLNATAATDTHGLYNSNMGSSARGGISRSGSSGSYTYSTRTNMTNMANKPVNYVTFYNAARFANWLMNGQPSGAQNASTTEDGFYTFDGTQTITAEGTHSGSQIGGQDWVAIASEDEWYQAAYYDGDGSYFDYPTQSDSITTERCELPK